MSNTNCRPMVIDSLTIAGRGKVLVVKEEVDDPYKIGDFVYHLGVEYRIKNVERMGKHPHVGLVVKEFPHPQGSV